MRYISLIFIVVISFCGQALAEDIVHATSEDIAEFDQFLANEPMVQPKDKPAPREEKVPPTKGARDEFRKSERGDMGNRPESRPPRRKGPPRDDRERGRRNPPPKPGEGPPPPPPK